MKLTRAIASVATTIVLSAAALSASAAGGNGFASLQGVEAQPLSIQEMQTITGELNALDIAAALTALAAKLGNAPKLQAAALAAAQFYVTNADAINAAFAKLGILTPCKSCTP